jgi:hypothetical protein
MRLKDDIETKEENFKKDREILLHYCEAETKVYKQVQDNLTKDLIEKNEIIK